MNSFIILAFITIAFAHSHSGEYGNSGGSGLTSHIHRTFTYNVVKTKSSYPVFVSYFITNNFINLVHENYNYNNDYNFTTYYIYYYSKIDDTQCIYFDSEFNNLNYTLIDYSNINLINNTNKINFNLVSKRYCLHDTNYILMIGIIVSIMICCCICCECKCESNDYNKNSLY
tara:strand:- start:78 stop:593 length:516 start_codon:yes stop_codon:yes gene_type:complete